jgi:hypothetical protein
MTETQRRFLREIAARIGESRIHEVRLFPAIRQGGIESGVAIVAARPPEPIPPDMSIPPAEDFSDELGVETDIETVIPVVVDGDTAPPAKPHFDPDTPRFEILSARYKLVIKGTERGAWEAEVRHEADAPLDTIDRVVRGVALRTGEDGEPESIEIAKFREALSDAPFLSDDDFTSEHGAS